MNPAADLLSELTTRGVTIAASGASLDLYPSSALSPDLLARIRALKPQLLELLHASAHAIVTPDEWTLLATLALHPGLTRTDLARATRLAPQPLAHALRNLTRRAEIAAGPAGNLYLHVV